MGKKHLGWIGKCDLSRVQLMTRPTSNLLSAQARVFQEPSIHERGYSATIDMRSKQAFIDSSFFSLLYYQFLNFRISGHRIHWRNVSEHPPHEFIRFISIFLLFPPELVIPQADVHHIVERQSRNRMYLLQKAAAIAGTQYLLPTKDRCRSYL